MRPRKASNSFKHRVPDKEQTGEDVKRTQQARRSTLAQILFGGDSKASEKKEPNGIGRSSTGQAASNSQCKEEKHSKGKKKNLATGGGGLFQSHQQRKTGEEAEMRPKIMHVVVMGPKKAGKTTLLKVLAANQQQQEKGGIPLLQEQYSPTLEDDTFHIQLQNGPPDARHPREIILFHDTPGISDFGNIEFRRAHIQVADAFLLVYSTVDTESFNRMDILKKQLEKERLTLVKDKKEVPIVVVSTKGDIATQKVDSEFALHWANRERVKLFETCASDRDSIVDAIHHLAGKFFSRETKFSLSRRLKPEKSSSQIIMDF